MTIKKPSAVESPYITTDTTPTRLASSPVAGGGVSTVAATVSATASVTADANTTSSSTGSNVSYYTSGIEGIAGLANYGRVFDGANVYVTLEQPQYNTYNTNYAGSANVGGANGQVQFNDAGLFAGSASLTFDGANLVVGGKITGTQLSTTGNITGGYFIGNGSQLTGISASSNKILNGNSYANIASANGSLVIGINGGNTWTFDSISTLTAPGGSQWTNEANSDAYFTSSLDGYVHLQSLFADGNVGSEVFLEHGLLALTAHSLGANTDYTWTFDNGGNLTLPGNTFQINYANGTPASLGSTYGNANVVANLAALGSNPVSTTGNVTGGNLLTGGLISATSTITSAANIVGGNLRTGGLISATANITGGNILTGGLLSVTGNITGGNINSSTLNNSGNISVVASGNTWTFGSTGNLTVPATNSVPARISTQTTLANEKGFDLRITAGNTDGCSRPGGDMYLSAGVGYNGISHGAGNVNIVTGDRYGSVTGNIWRFDSSGALTLPLGGVRIKDTAGNSIAFGLNAGFSLQGIEAVAIGSLAGNNRQGDNAVAIGNTAGAGGSVSTNYVSGAESPSTTLVVVSTTGIGPGMIISGTGFFGNITVVTVTNSTTLEISASAGFTPSGTLTFTGSQGDEAVAIGVLAGYQNQGSGAVAVGGLAGYNLQGDNAVAIGGLAGNNSQGTQAVAVGLFAGQEDQGQFSVAIGGGAGQQTQGEESVAIGSGAGSTAQGNAAVAIGGSAGAANQRINSVAIGASAGASTQGQYAVAIGASAGVTNQGNNSIILNATGANLNQTTANTFTVAPVRNDVANIGQVVFYNTTSKEITYGNTISVAGNITGGNIQGTIGDILNVNSTNLTVTNILAPSPGNVVNIGAGGNNNLVVSNVLVQVQNVPVSVAGNVTGGNILTGGLISATSTITSAANITGGNVLTGGLLSATGNITGGNITTTGLISTASLSITGNTATVTSANYSIGYLNVPQVSLAGNVTTALTDAGKHYYSTSASNLALTIANNTSVSWPIGTAISIVNGGTANILINQGTGVSMYLAGNATAGNRVLATFGMATIMNTAANVWFINGTGLT